MSRFALPHQLVGLLVVVVDVDVVVVRRRRRRYNTIHNNKAEDFDRTGNMVAESGIYYYQQ